MLRYSFELAVRGLRRFPKSTAMVVFTVALGLSACMTTVTLLHVLSADPLPGRSQHLYRAFVNTVKAEPRSDANADITGVYTEPNNQLEPRDVEALSAGHKAVRQAAMADITVDVVSGNGRHTLSQQNVLATSADFFRMFGVAFLHGEGWTKADDAEGAPLATIDTYTATKLFGTTAAVGKTIRLGKTLFRVIGVIEPFAPEPHFFGLEAWDYGTGDHPGEGVFVPYTAAMAAQIVENDTFYGLCDAGTQPKDGLTWNQERCSWLNYWVQLDTPQQVAAYRTYLMDYSRQQKVLAGYSKPAVAHLDSVSQWLQKNAVVTDSVRLNVWLAASFLVLCMFNVAGLLTARFLRRSSEIGIRRALGAPWLAVFLHCVLESGLACLVGGVLALPLTLIGLWIVRQQDTSFAGLARLDPAMFVALFGLAIAVGVLVGLLPAWRASRIEPGLQIKTN